MHEGIFPLILYSKYKTQMMIPLLYLLIHTIKVCLCDNSKPVCDNQKYFSRYTYPGARFQVQAVLVGQKIGIVPGVVHATLRNTSAVLVDLQHAQATGKSCTALNYTVFSSNTEKNCPSK